MTGRTPSHAWSIGSWPLLITASGGAGTGWTSRAMPIPPATTPITRFPRSPAIAITSLIRSTPISLLTSSSASSLPATSCARRVRPEQAGQQIVATGFLALSRRYATAPYELWHLTLEDAIDTTGRAFLGMTFRCARCHDHKFDPVTQRDYYALYGIFASTTFPYAGSEELVTKKFPRMNFVPTAPPERGSIQPQGPGRSSQGPGRGDRGTGAEGETLTRARSGNRRSEAEAMRAEREKLRRSRAAARASRRLCRRGGQAAGRGRFSGEEIPGVPAPSFLAACRGLRSSTGLPRRGSGGCQRAVGAGGVDHAARSSPDRPGDRQPGLAASLRPGNRGDPLELRDPGRAAEPSRAPRLARGPAGRQRLVDQGPASPDLALADLPAFQRRRCTERDDRPRESLVLAVRAPPAGRRIDPGRDARGLGRARPRRAGPHPFPPIERWPWTQHNPFKATYPSKRRTVFLMTQRLVKHPYLAIFDGPDTNTSTDVRPRSTVRSRLSS